MKKRISWLVFILLAFRVFSQPFKINYDDPETAIQYVWEAMACREAYDEAFSIFQELSYKGYHKAQYWLAHMFVLGEGRKEDFAKSFYWHSKASEQEHPVSLIELAAMYDNGDGVKKDSPKAKKLYAKAISVLEKSAQNGNMYHQRLLGDCYSNPLFGELQNKEKALYWYRKAAAQVNILAKKTLKEYGEYEDFDFYTSKSEQKITSKTLYQTGIYGQTFELTEYTNGSKSQLLLFMSDNTTKITDTYDSSMPTVYYIWSKWFSNPSEYSKAVERCKTFFNIDMTLIYLAEMKDICDIASCCTSKVEIMFCKIM